MSNTYLHDSVVYQFAWAPLSGKFHRISREEFQTLEQQGTLQYKGEELTLNYILVVREPGQDPDSVKITFDLGLGNVPFDCVYRAGLVCDAVLLTMEP